MRLHLREPRSIFVLHLTNKLRVKDRLCLCYHNFDFTPLWDWDTFPLVYREIKRKVSHLNRLCHERFRRRDVEFLRGLILTKIGTFRGKTTSVPVEIVSF